VIRQGPCDGPRNLATSRHIGTNPLPPKHRGVNYSQTALPKHLRAMNAGMQMPVLTFTKAAVTSDPPMMYPAISWPMWKLHPAAMSMVVAEVQPKRRRTP
jgi:hypothetical protein